MASSCPALGGQKRERTEEQCERWLSRIHEVQTKQMTPEKRAALQAKVERSRAAEQGRRQAKACKSHALRSQALMSEGLRQMSAAAAPVEYSAVRDRWSSAQEACTSRAVANISAMAAPPMALALQEARVVREEDEEAEENEGLAEIARLVGAAEPANMVTAAGDAASETEFNKLLEQLRNEPTGEEELMAKFAIYEKYSEEVVKMRETLFRLYEENKAALPPAVNADMAKQLKQVDRTEAMGIPDDARGWFVYHMMKKAGHNNASIGAILEHFEKKLEFLAKNDQDECPICLESFSDERPADTLGCCHKVCRDCWQHWVAVCNNHPFCPLCKNDEFHEAVHSRATHAGGY